MANQYTGKIILIDRERGFGFIESDNPELHIFFPKSSTLTWNKLEIYDVVQFEILTSAIPKYIGQPYAGNVAWPEGYKPNLEKKYGASERWVGKMTKWDGQRGFIEVSTLSKRIYLKHTTLAHCHLNKVDTGSFFVVNPIKSTKPHSEYFALFAYPLNLESNPKFLQEAWKKNDEQGILDGIEERLLKMDHADRLWQMYCSRYLNDLGEADCLQEIVGMIDKFRRWGYEPDLVDLEKAAGGNLSILLALWIRGKTKYFNPDAVSAFFKSTSDEWRDQVLGRADETHRIRFLKEYGTYLVAQGQLDANTPRLRYLLKTAKGYGDTVWDAVGPTIETYLEQLRLEDKIQLWVLGLFKDLDMAKSLSRISLENTGLWTGIINRKSEQGESLTKIILDQFLDSADKSRFDEWYPFFIPVMRAVSKKWPELAATARPRLRQLLTTDQLLTLGLLSPDDYMEEHSDFLKAERGGWPMYALVRYALIRYRQKKITPEEIRRLFLAHGFSAERLLAEIPGMTWSQVLQPCRTKPEIDFEIAYLEDVSEACRLAEFTEVQVFGKASLATCIFESIKKMEGFHARLWLNGFVPRNYYDYQGFREPFKKLTREEKQRFVQPSQEVMEEMVDVQVVSEIPVCQTFREDEDLRVYEAKLRNFHFKQDKYRLKTLEGFTGWGEREGLTYGMNFLSGSRDFDGYTVEVWVKENMVIAENGFNQLLNEITRKQLKGSMLKEGQTPIFKKKGDPSYTDDLQLQETILNYLKSNQVPGHQIILVSPHAFEYEIIEGEKLPVHSSHSVTGIFTMKLEDGYGLVWEFYDLNHENATYVFKVTSNNCKAVTDRLAGVISLRSGVRAALNANNSKHVDQTDQLELFRKGLGYVGNFKINRGVKGAFKRWEKKLKEKVEMPTPEFIDDAEWMDVLEHLKLEDSRKRPGKSGAGKTQIRSNRIHKKTEDEKVKTASSEEERIFNQPGKPENSEGKIGIEKIRELNSLLSGLLSKS